MACRRGSNLRARASVGIVCGRHLFSFYFLRPQTRVECDQAFESTTELFRVVWMYLLACNQLVDNSEIDTKVRFCLRVSQ